MIEINIAARGEDILNALSAGSRMTGFKKHLLGEIMTKVYVFMCESNTSRYWIGNSRP